MALDLEGKKTIVAQVSKVAQSALSVVVADYHGLTVDQMTELRKQARGSGVYVRIVRNTLAKRAIQGTDYACIEEALTGPTVLAFSQEDPGAAARLFKAFSVENKAFEVKALSINGKLLDANQIDVLAKMPTLNQAYAQLMSVMLGPVTKLARTLNEFPAGITRAISAVADKKKSEAA